MRLPPRLFLLFSTIPLFLAAAGSAAAHEGQGPSIDADSQQLRQGQSVQVVGDDFEVGEQVQLELWSFGDVHRLASASVDDNGHFAAAVTVPAQVPDGYAEIQATSGSGASAVLIVLVGEEPDLSEGLPAQPPAGGPPIWSDPSVLLLGALIVGGAVALAYLLLRPKSRRPRRPEPARREPVRRSRRAGG